MNVLHSTQFYLPFVGGAEKYCQEVSEGLVRAHNLRVSVVTTNVTSSNPPTFTITGRHNLNGVVVNRLRSLSRLGSVYGNKNLESRHSELLRIFYASDTRLTWPFALGLRAVTSSVPQHFQRIVNEMRENDLVAIFNLITGMSSLAFIAAKAARTPVVVFPMVHADMVSYKQRSLHELLKNCNAVICSTEFERRTLVRMGVRKNLASVVPIGVKADAPTEKATRDFRALYGINANDFVICYIGRREFDKGYSHTLKASALLARKGLSPKLIVMGSGDRHNGSEDYVYLSKNRLLIDLGVADDTTKFKAIAASSVLTLPSRAESFGIVFVEAFLLGKPVIGARTGPVESVVRNGVDGFLIPFGDTQELAGALKHLYDDPESGAKMGRAGKERAESDFTEENNQKQIKAIYEQVLQN